MSIVGYAVRYHDSDDGSVEHRRMFFYPTLQTAFDAVRLRAIEQFKDYASDSDAHLELSNDLTALTAYDFRLGEIATYEIINDYRGVVWSPSIEALWTPE